MVVNPAVLVDTSPWQYSILLPRVILRHHTRVGLQKSNGGSEYSWIHHETYSAFSTLNPQETGAPTTLSRPATIWIEGAVEISERQNTLAAT